MTAGLLLACSARGVLGEATAFRNLPVAGDRSRFVSILIGLRLDERAALAMLSWSMPMRPLDRLPIPQIPTNEGLCNRHFHLSGEVRFVAMLTSSDVELFSADRGFQVFRRADIDPRPRRRGSARPVRSVAVEPDRRPRWAAGTSARAPPPLLVADASVDHDAGGDVLGVPTSRPVSVGRPAAPCHP